MIDIVGIATHAASLAQGTACGMKTVLSLYALLMYTIYLYLSTLFTEGTVFMKPSLLYIV